MTEHSDQQPSDDQGQQKHRVARSLGILAQAVVLGTLLFVAIGALMAVQEGARVFQYQAF